MSDNSSRRFNTQLMLASAVLAVAGCATSPVGTADLRADSLLRVGDRIFFSESLGVQSSRHLGVECADGKTRLIFTDREGQRRYPGGSARYSRSQELSAVADLRRPELASACAVKPELKLVGETANGTQLLVDRASISAAPAGLLRVWVGFDYAAIGFDPPYNAPFGEKRELLLVNCALSAGVILAGYDVDSDGMVTDGLVFPRGSLEPLTDDYLTVAQAACGAPASLKNRPDWIARTGKVAPSVTAQPVSITALVRGQISALNLPPPLRTLRRINTLGVSTYQGKSSSFEQVFSIEPTPIVGVFKVRVSGDGYESETLSFMGIEALSSRSKFFRSQSATSTETLDVRFEGDWMRLRSGSRIGVKVKVATEATIGGASVRDANLNCVVAESVLAETLNPTLQGMAKRVACERPPDQFKRVSTYWYLEDYGFFFREGESPNSFYFSKERIVRAEP